MTPTAEWLEIYEKTRERRRCPADLNAYFTAGEIAGKKLDRLAIGPVSLPSGEVVVRDPLAGLCEE
ncbi:MAG: hypothetical protein LBU26_01250, partial [Synergistaceae bacterium]|nr:hypothetical protein [Synergistaceae bacterium]